MALESYLPNSRAWESSDFAVARTISRVSPLEVGEAPRRAGEGRGSGGSLQPGAMGGSTGKSPPGGTEASDTCVYSLESCSLSATPSPKVLFIPPQPRPRTQAALGTN